MKIKLTMLITMTFGLCTYALAGDYSAPEVKFKKMTPPTVEAKPVTLDEGYKYEAPVANDRQIASEEDTDREPSSIATKIETKKEIEYEKDTVEPQPWTYNKNKKQDQWFNKGLEK